MLYNYVASRIQIIEKKLNIFFWNISHFKKIFIHLLPLPTRIWGLGERLKLLCGVWGGAPAAIAFWRIWHQNGACFLHVLCDSEHNVICSKLVHFYTGHILVNLKWWDWDKRQISEPVPTFFCAARKNFLTFIYCKLVDGLKLLYI